jgi:hypothetical protein
MAVIAPPPAPAKSAPPSRTNGHPPPNGHGRGTGGPAGNGNGHTDGNDEPESAPLPPKRRRSIWPLLLDLGLVMMLFGFIIIGRFLIPIGAVLFVVALAGWLREARRDYSGLSD